MPYTMRVDPAISWVLVSSNAPMVRVTPGSTAIRAGATTRASPSLGTFATMNVLMTVTTKAATAGMVAARVGMGLVANIRMPTIRPSTR